MLLYVLSLWSCKLVASFGIQFSDKCHKIRKFRWAFNSCITYASEASKSREFVLPKPTELQKNTKIDNNY